MDSGDSQIAFDKSCVPDYCMVSKRAMLPNWHADEKEAAIFREIVARRSYSQKHCESRFSRFYDGYWLPTRFGYDTRKVQYSSFLLTGLMTRAEALVKLEKLAYSPETLDADFAYIVSKLGISVEKLRGYHKMPLKTYKYYKNQECIFDLGVKALQMLGVERSVKR
jgi:hypothetical protein